MFEKNVIFPPKSLYMHASFALNDLRDRLVEQIASARSPVRQLRHSRPWYVRPRTLLALSRRRLFHALPSFLICLASFSWIPPPRRIEYESEKRHMLNYRLCFSNIDGHFSCHIFSSVMTSYLRPFFRRTSNSTPTFSASSILRRNIFPGTYLEIIFSQISCTSRPFARMLFDFKSVYTNMAIRLFDIFLFPFCADDTNWLFRQFWGLTGFECIFCCAVKLFIEIKAIYLQFSWNSEFCDWSFHSKELPWSFWF